MRAYRKARVQEGDVEGKFAVGIEEKAMSHVMSGGQLQCLARGLSIAIPAEAYLLLVPGHTS